MKIVKIILIIIGTILCIFLVLIMLYLYTYVDHNVKGKITASKMQINNFKTCLFVYKDGIPPTTKEGLKALVKEGIIKRIPLDPWGNEYQYRSPGLDGREYDIWSYGRDGKPGGRGFDKDITSWEIK